MNNSVISGSAKFKQLRHLAAAGALAAAVAGCAGAPAVKPAAPAAPSPQPLARMVVATPDADHDVVAQLLAGEMALTHSDLKAAAAAYDKAAPLSADPEVAERATALALAVHDDAAAQRALDRWQRLGATPPQLAQSRAELALDRGDAAAAKQQLEQLLATGGDDAWRQFGRVLVGARDSAQAGRLLEALATPERLPADERAWLAMSELGDRLGRRPYALQIAHAAAARFRTATAYAWAAQLTLRAGDRAAARALLEKAIARNPVDTHLRLAYATMLAQGGDYPAAARFLGQGKQSADIYNLRAALAAQAQDRATLARLYRQVQSAPPEIRQSSDFLLGQLAEMQGLKADALDWYDQVGDEDPHAFDADLRSAIILHQQGKRAEAHELLGQLQTAYLDQPEQLRKAYEADADLYMTEQRYPQAEMAFSRALQVQPDDPGLLYGRGLAYAESGDIDRAVSDLRRLLELRPADVDASNALGYTLADANRDLAEARRLIELARKAKPADPAIADSWGWLQYRLGHLEEAAGVLRQAWKQRPDADVGVHLGEVLWKSGQRDEATRVFEQVRKLDPDNTSLRDTLKRLQP
ncbi:tetratricopeptide repeat protein [Dyella sp.]|jgi:tetratricopeptide (TPR) repeat protein|uniref:tetratricopeptide repeat protein n=1 Tax=Dyella sp. TaxID=1869338 RepID=UPI002D796F79|nr:tetratricopeptide repeat protein [Dyella sp.]HET6431059.1 tetratricopeptide repeat protein [Dyella sp.]